MSLRKAKNEKCKDCIHDDLAAGTWLQQVTLCPANDCPLYEVRPKSKSAIPENVLSYYGIKQADLKDIASEECTDIEKPNCSPQVVKLNTSQDLTA